MKQTCGVLAIAAALAVTYGCGGGGGGAAPADVAGTVLLVGGGPVQGASVNVGGAGITTDVNGAFVIRNAPSNATQLSVTGSGIQTLNQALPTLTPNTRNDLGNIFVVATGGAYTAIVTGTVVRSDTLQTVPGAKVVMNGQGAVADTQGGFTIGNLSVGLMGGPNVPVGLMKAAGFEDTPIFLTLPLGASPPNNDLGLLKISPPVGTIPPGPSDIHGTVSLQGQAALGGTTVTLLDKASGSTVGTVVTDSTGAYSFWVAANTYTIRAQHTGFTTQQVDVTLTRPDVPVTQNFTLTP